MIGSIGGIPGANPLSGMGEMTTGTTPGGNPLAGMAGSLGIGGGEGGSGGAGESSGLAPVGAASESQGESFGATLQSMIIDSPSESKAYSGDLAARFAAGDRSIDAHQVSIASAKAGVEIQMATRTISSAVSAVRTLFQMQV